MKWHKRPTNFTQDPLMQKLFDELGYHGMIAYERLLELIAARMETHLSTPEITVSKLQLRKELGFKRKKLLSFLELIENVYETKVLETKMGIKITMPELLELADRNAVSSNYRSSTGAHRVDKTREEYVEGIERSTNHTEVTFIEQEWRKK